MHARGIAMFVTMASLALAGYLAVPAQALPVARPGITASQAQATRAAPAAGTNQGQAIANTAQAWVTSPVTPYCWGGGDDSGPTHGDGEDPAEYSGPRGKSGCYPQKTVGFDCSGLVKYAIYHVLGISLYHLAQDESEGITDRGPNVKPAIVSLANLEPGDVVVFGSSRTTVTHAGIYIGHGTIVNAYDYKNAGDNGPDNEYWGVTDTPLRWSTDGFAFSEGVRYWKAAGKTPAPRPTPKPIPTGTRKPPAPAPSPSTGTSSATAWVVNQEDGTVVPISVASQAPGRPVRVGSGPDDIALTPNGRTVYVANQASGTVTPVSTRTRKAGKAIRVSDPGAIAITPDGRTAYVANADAGTVTPIDIAASRALAPISLGASDPAFIAITPNSKIAYVLTSAPEQVIPITTASNTAGSPLRAGSGPDSIAITPDGRTAYIADDVSGLI